MASQRRSAVAQAIRKHKENTRSKTTSRDEKAPTTRSKRREVFPFFELPGELRNQIYDLALTTGAVRIKGCIDKKSNTHCLKRVGRWSPTGFKHLNASLIATCKKAYEEAAPLLYRKNKFIFDTPQSMFLFLMRIHSYHPRIKDWIEYLEISKCSHSALAQSYMHAVFVALIGFSNLQYLHLNISEFKKGEFRKFARDSHSLISYLADCKGNLRAGLEVISVSHASVDDNDKEEQDESLRARLEKYFVKKLT